MSERISNKEIVQRKIIKACTNRFLALGDLAEILDMNKHTLRAHYIYPLVKSGRLMREPAPPAKSTVKYRAVR